VGDWWNQPMRRSTPGPEPDGSGSGTGRGRALCPWCSAVAEPGTNCCPSCGAVMAQRESLGGMVIPGVTDVDPGMRQRSLSGSLLGTQARMNMLGAVGHAAGPSAQIVTAAAMLARDSLGGMFRPGTNPEDVGRPSQAAIDMAGRLDSHGQDPDAAATDERSDEPASSDEPA
jgi:RNA polymerase subunit RPABC4/transcription elongation factor Spt4